MTHTLYHGDCLQVMPTLEANSVDTIVTDPPYGLSFMGKDWDHGVPGVQFWREALRVAKPGAMLLAFGGSRTFHRLTCAIEDAGWEVRDCVMWLFGQGFPKSLDQSKAIQGLFLREFLAGVRRLNGNDASSQEHYSGSCRQCGVSLHAVLAGVQDAAQSLGDAPLHSHLFEPLTQIQEDTERRYTASCVGLSSHLSTMGYRNRTDADAWQLLLEVSSCLCPACFAQLVGAGSGCEVRPDGIDWSSIDASSVVSAWAKSEIFYRMLRMSPEPYNHYSTQVDKFKGWGSALKPSFEPIVLAMKPLDGTFAENALTWGVAGLNVDGARIAGQWTSWRKSDGTVSEMNMDSHAVYGKGMGDVRNPEYPAGRWPANLILDEEAAAGAEWARFFYVAKASRAERNAGLEGMEARLASDRNAFTGLPDKRMDHEQNRLPAANFHPTVKPLALMRYLVRLTATPTGGVVLDPFMGSGTTGVACAMEDRHFIGVELDAGYYDIARKRIESVQPALMEAAD